MIVPRTLPKPTRLTLPPPEVREQYPLIITVSPSSRKPRDSPFGNTIGERPIAVISAMLPYEPGSLPEIVPEA